MNGNTGGPGIKLIFLPNLDHRIRQYDKKHKKRKRKTGVNRIRKDGSRSSSRKTFFLSLELCSEEESQKDGDDFGQSKGSIFSVQRTEME